MFQVIEYMTKNGMCYDLSGAVHRGESSLIFSACLHRTEKARVAVGIPCTSSLSYMCMQLPRTAAASQQALKLTLALAWNSEKS